MTFLDNSDNELQEIADPNQWESSSTFSDLQNKLMEAYLC